MNKRIIAYLLAFSIGLTPASVLAASQSSTGGSRYLVQSTKGFWKSAFGARHEFEDGFTADLSDLQLRLAKFAGLKPIPVKKLSILPALPADELGDEQGVTLEIEARPDAGRKPASRPVPTSQMPWGVAMLNGGAGVTSPVTSVSIAILDTGIAKDHPDLSRRLKDCKDFTQAKSPLVDGSCDDKNGHGTHVAGIIAADGGADGKGIYGMDPNALVMAYKVCGNNGSCWSDDIAVAIRKAADMGADIINMSLGSDTVSSLIADAVAYASEQGVLVVAAAGNDGPYQDSIDYPGALADVVAVGALDKTKAVPDFSSRGINSLTEAYVVNERDIEFAAPGVNIESTIPGGYGVMSGTSMASPHVAGLAALLWQGTAGDTRTKLNDIGVDIGDPLDDDATGWGVPILIQ